MSRKCPSPVADSDASETESAKSLQLITASTARTGWLASITASLGGWLSSAAAIRSNDRLIVSEDCLEPICIRRADTEAILQSKNRLLISLAAANTYSERMLISYPASRLAIA